eukprot:scaffold396468_cov33-Prasinocladus_malaysianus.AAC.1
MIDTAYSHALDRETGNTKLKSFVPRASGQIRRLFSLQFCAKVLRSNGEDVDTLWSELKSL